MSKKLNDKQIAKGLRHMETAKSAILRTMKEIVAWNKFCKGKNFIGGTGPAELNSMKEYLHDSREWLAKLQRKYL